MMPKAPILTLLMLVLLTFTARAHEDSAPVDSQKAVPVAASKVSRGMLRDWAFAEGIAQGIRREYLSFERPGRVTFIAKDDNGIQLRAGSQVSGPQSGETFGQLLGRVDEREDTEVVRGYESNLSGAKERISQTRAQLEQARNNLELARDNFQRTESIWQQKLIPKEQYDAARTDKLNAEQALSSAEAELKAAISQERSAIAQLNQAKVGLEKTSLFAPFDGVLRKVNVREGDYWGGPAAVMSDREREASAAMVIVDTSQYEVTLNVPYYATGKLAEGQAVFLSHSPAALVAAAQANDMSSVTQGRVFSVSPSISLEQRAVEVKVHTIAGAELLLDGMFVTAWILVEERPQTLKVPNQAILMRDNKPFVYMLDADNRAQLRAVQTGIEDLQEIEILEGLNDGDQVVTVGKHKLADGTPVRLVNGGAKHE
ncbi:efflux RND transporter periplasmic adaptor subunit [Aliiglaciecola sp. CAU 1673]|uniref:efflux RND transporter periplasmic adaptor subunit n=1 Tax=Aliiglaciecola sp. CAU 1673 TaxID=3032595 RepID=UPI0023DB5C07|nr:efflux RND transporter periplasmic adaptor subunit [Aliiglaciecola sp. CAU 1673]MDF2177375.1 efflux RND transporter periplasmic adaptor subunit [Aliiglaciecola sp. CAU 1673]